MLLVLSYMIINSNHSTSYFVIVLYWDTGSQHSHPQRGMNPRPMDQKSIGRAAETKGHNSDQEPPLVALRIHTRTTLIVEEYREEDPVSKKAPKIKFTNFLSRLLTVFRTPTVLPTQLDDTTKTKQGKTAHRGDNRESPPSIRLLAKLPRNAPEWLPVSAQRIGIPTHIIDQNI